MARVGNSQQGYRGKLNGQVFFKGADGSTQVRTIVVPKNPKTLAQRVQRVIAKTVSANYKEMKAIADHSFEGQTMGFKCMNRFRKLNMQHMRSRAAYLQEQGISLYEYYNFIGIGQNDFAPAAVIISEGSLNQVYADIANGVGTVNIGGNTYQSVINALGARRGDQMTFVTVERDSNGKFSFHYARIILDPRNTDGAASLDSAFITDNAVNLPSSRNSGSFVTLAIDGNTLKFKLTQGTVAAAGIIMSRRSGSEWFRSNCQLALSETALGSLKLSLMTAADQADAPTVIDVDSEQFLNGAGVGGSQGASAPAQGEVTEPTLSGTVRLNGASQAIGGGSAYLSSLTSFAFVGQNLTGAEFKMSDNGGADIQPSSQNDNAVTWNIQGAAVGDVYRFYMDDVLKYTVTIQSSGGGDDEGGEQN